MIIYVSGPYSADTEEGRLANVQKAIDVSIELIKKGYTVFTPHLSHYTDTIAHAKGVDILWHEWMRQDIELLEKCDAMYFIGHSRGADLELDEAIKLGMTIYTKIENVPKAGDGA